MAAHTIFNRPRRGISLAYTIICLGVFMGFASLGVDYGRTRVVKTELRRAADASARAAASALGSTATVQNLAVQYAAANTSEGAPIQLNVSEDIEIGTWNTSTRTFIALTGSARNNGNAVRVTARRTAARGNAVGLMFGSAIGRPTCDVQASSTVALIPPQFGIVGLDYIKMSGNSSDSYWSSTGVMSSLGSIASNGDITVKGAAVVHGDAHPGPGHSVLGGGTVTGNTQPLTAPMSFPTPLAGSYATVNDNAYAKPWMNGASFSLTNGQVAILPGGHYYFNSFSTAGTSTLIFTGPATVYCYGDVKIGGQTNTYNNIPGNLTLCTVQGPSGTSGTVTMSAGSALYANINAPLSPITMSGSGDIYGSVVGKSIDMTGGSTIHYDLALCAGKIIRLVQ